MTDQTETLRAALDTMPGLFGGINTPNGLHPDFTLGIAEYLVAALATPPVAHQHVRCSVPGRCHECGERISGDRSDD